MSNPNPPSRTRTLITFTPCFGVRSPSPFTLKAEALLCMAELPYQCRYGVPQDGPRGKLPVLVDGDRTIPDSRNIRRHIEAEYGIDFNAGLSPESRSHAHALQRVIEEHLYWAQSYFRWTDHRALVRDHYFAAIPRPLRDVVTMIVYRQVRRDLKGQGLGRMTRDEIFEMATEDLQALKIQLGDKPFMFGDRPTALDASAYGMLANMLIPELSSPLSEMVDRDFSEYVQRFESTVSGIAPAAPPQPLLTPVAATA